MRRYIFHFDDNSKRFRCEYSNEVIEEQRAPVAALKHLENFNFKVTRATSSRVRLANKVYSVTIENYDLFKAYGLDKYIPSLSKKIEKKLNDTKKKKVSNRGPVEKAIKIVCGTALVSLLAIGAKNVIVDKTEVPDNSMETVYEEPEIEMPEVIQVASGNTAQTEYQPALQDTPMLLDIGSEKDVYETDTQEMIATSSINYIDLNYELTDDLVKQEHAYQNYNELATRFGNKWGVDPRIVLAMITQETGGYSKNLMQIEFNAWEGTRLHCYNFQTGMYEDFLLTNDTNKVSNSEYTVITEKDINTYDITAISIGTCLYRYALTKANNNPVLAMLYYNQGLGNMEKIYDETLSQTGLDRNVFKNDPNRLEILDYTYASGQGDPNYVYNVTQYLMDNDNPYLILYLDENEQVQASYYDISYTPSKSKGM